MVKYRKITGSLWRDYEIYVSREGLYGIAFFGHKFRDRRRHHNARRKIQYIYQRLLNQYNGLRVKVK